MKEKRLDYELMRILAIFLVVFNHTDNQTVFLMSFFYDFNSNTISKINRKRQIICYSSIE